MEFLKNLHLPFDTESPFFQYLLTPILNNWFLIPLVIIIDILFIIKIVIGTWNLKNVSKKEIIKITIIALLANVIYILCLLISNLKISPITFGIKEPPVSIEWYLFMPLFSIFMFIFGIVIESIFGRIDLPLGIVLLPALTILLLFMVLLFFAVFAVIIKTSVIKLCYRNISFTKIIFWLAFANMISTGIVVIPFAILNFRTTMQQERVNRAQKTSTLDQALHHQ